MDDKITGFKKNKLVLHEVEPLKLCDTKKKNPLLIQKQFSVVLAAQKCEFKNTNSKTRSSKNSEDLVILCYV